MDTETQQLCLAAITAAIYRDISGPHGQKRKYTRRNPAAAKKPPQEPPQKKARGVSPKKKGWDLFFSEQTVRDNYNNIKSMNVDAGSTQGGANGIAMNKIGGTWKAMPADQQAKYIERAMALFSAGQPFSVSKLPNSGVGVRLQRTAGKWTHEKLVVVKNTRQSGRNLAIGYIDHNGNATGPLPPIGVLPQVDAVIEKYGLIRADQHQMLKAVDTQPSAPEVDSFLPTTTIASTSADDTKTPVVSDSEETDVDNESGEESGSESDSSESDSSESESESESDAGSSSESDVE